MFAKYVKNYTLGQQNTRDSVTAKQRLKRIFVPNLVLHIGAAQKARDLPAFTMQAGPECQRSTT
jgi:hypothetical protein